MGTPKRERQKANKLQKQIDEAKADRVASVKRNSVRWGLVAVLAIAAVVVIAWIGGAFSGDDDVTDDGGDGAPSLILDAGPAGTTTRS